MFGDQRIWTFSHPADVLACPDMSLGEKRSLLADWASDRHAVENVPAMRQLPSGAIVSLDAILAGLRELDQAARQKVVSGRPRSRGRAFCLPSLRRRHRPVDEPPEDDGPTSGGAAIRLPKTSDKLDASARHVAPVRPSPHALALRRKRRAALNQLRNSG